MNFGGVTLKVDLRKMFVYPKRLSRYVLNVGGNMNLTKRATVKGYADYIITEVYYLKLLRCYVFANDLKIGTPISCNDVGIRIAGYTAVDSDCVVLPLFCIGSSDAQLINLFLFYVSARAALSLRLPSDSKVAFTVCHSPKECP